jgi:phenylacetyl-CoA:acceptor oxidoreductase
MWARTLLVSLVGALEVPGSIMGTKVRLNRPGDNRHKTVIADRDGFMDYPFNGTTKQEWVSQSNIRNGYRTLVPLSANSPWSPALGPAHLPWLFQKETPENWPEQSIPEMWICYRTNPAISSWDATEVAKRIAEFPFTVAFAYTHDETNHMADVLLPEATDLESLQLSRLGGTGSGEQYWTQAGWAIRQPAVDPVVDAMDMTDIGTKICERVGILEKYNEAINRGAAGMRLKKEDFDYSLDVTVPHGRDEVWDAVARAASHDLTQGEQVVGIDWFKEHGYMLRPFPRTQWYLYPTVKESGIRFEMPYQERLQRHGAQLANRLHEVGINWWDKQLGEYESLPTYECFPDIWVEYAREVGRDPDEFPLWAITARSMQYSWGANAGIPLISEVADNVAGHKGLVINRRAARGMGIADGDLIDIESATGITQGHAVLREGIRPDTVLMLAQFDHWVTPVAKDFGAPSLNTITPLAVSLTDATGSGADLVRVKITPATADRRAAI